MWKMAIKMEKMGHCVYNDFVIMFE